MYLIDTAYLQLRQFRKLSASLISNGSRLVGRKHFKCYTQEYQLMHKGLMTMEGGLYALLSDDATYGNEVHLTKAKKLEFMLKLGSKSKAPLKVCGNLLNKLIRNDLITRIDRGTYMLNPQFRDKQNSNNSHHNLMQKYLEYKHKR